MAKVKVFLGNEIITEIKFVLDKDVFQLRQELSDFIKDHDVHFLNDKDEQIPQCEEETTSCSDLLKVNSNSIYLVNKKDEQDLKNLQTIVSSPEQIQNEINQQLSKKSSASQKSLSPVANDQESIFNQSSNDQNLSFLRDQTNVNQEEIPLSKHLDIAIIYDETLQMPLCFERCLQELFYYISCKDLGYIINTDNYSLTDISRLDNLIDQKIKELQIRLKCEQIQEDDIVSKVSKLENEVRVTNWNYSASLAKTILQIIKPLNIYYLMRYISKNNLAANKIKNQNIIFLISQTGAGKSTTMHFLAGSKMEEYPVDGIQHIGPSQITNDMLKEVKCSPNSKSETRYMIPVDIRHENNTITIVDSPGIGDTRGAEIDISNSISIANGICDSKSVRLVVLQSFRNIGDRLEGIKDLAKYIINMTKNIKQLLSSITYIFTKFPEGNQKTFLATLKDIKENMTESEKIDKNFCCFSDDLIKKAEQKKIIFLNPLNDKPSQVIENIMSSTKIKNPSNYFESSLSLKSQLKLNNQVRRLESQIQKAIIRGEGEFISYKLRQLINLDQNIKQDSLKQTLSECLKNLRQMLVKNFKDGTNNFNEKFYNNNLKQEDVVTYCERITLQDGFEKIINEFLREEQIPKKEAFTLNIDKLIEHIQVEIAKNNITNKYTIRALTQVQLIARYMETYNKHLEYIITQVRSKIDEIRDNFIKSLSKNKFSQSIEIFINYEESIIIYSDFIGDRQQMSNYLQKMENEIIQHFELIQDKLCSLLGQDNISKNDSQILQQLIKQMIEDQNECYKLNNEIQNKVQQKKDDTFHKLQGKFKELGNQLKSFSEDEFKSKEAIFEQYYNIYNIEDVKATLCNEFFQTFSHLKEQITRYSLSIENFITDLSQKRFNSSDFLKLSQDIKKLENVSWVQKYDQNIYSYAKENITNKILDNLFLLKEDLSNTNIDVQDIESFKKATNRIKQLQNIKVLEKSIPEIQSFIDNAMSNFIHKLQQIVEDIRSTFNINQSSNDLPFEAIYQKVQDFIVFLNECSNNQYTYISEIYNLKKQATDYITFQKNLSINQWNEHLTALKQYSDIQNDQKNIFKSANILIYSINEQKNLKERYQQLYKFYNKNDEEFLDTQLRQLTRYYNELADIIQENQQQIQLDQMYLCLEKIKNLRAIDDLLPTHIKFSALYQLYSKYLYANMSEQEIEVEKAIDNQDFDVVINYLRSVNQIKKVTQCSIKMQDIKMKLNKSIKELIINIKAQIHQLLFKHKVNEQSIQKLAKNLQIIEDAEGLEEYLDKNNSIIENQKYFKECLTKDLKQYMNDNIQNQIDNEQFDSASNELKVMDFYYETLKQYCYDQVPNEMLKLSKEIDSCLKKQVELFEKMDIEQYRISNPKNICDKLSQSNSGSSRKILELIEITIVGKLKNKLDVISKIQKKTQQDLEIKIIMSLTPYLPLKIQNLFQDLIVQIRDDISKQFEERICQLTSAINSDNYDIIEQELLLSAQEGDNSKKTQVQEAFTKKVQNILVQINININQDFDSIIQSDIIKLYQYKIFFQEDQSSLIFETINLIQDALLGRLLTHLSTIKAIFEPHLVNINTSHANNPKLEQALMWLVKLFKFKLAQPSCYQDILYKFDEAIGTKVFDINRIIIGCQTRFDDIIQQEYIDTRKLFEVLQAAQEQNQTITYLKKQSDLICQTTSQPILDLVNILKQVKEFNQMIDIVSEKLDQMFNQCFASCKELMENKQNTSMYGREIQFKKLNSIFTQISQFQRLEIFLDRRVNIENELKKASNILSANISQVECIILKTLENQFFEKTQTQTFNILYNNIKTLYQYVEPQYYSAKNVKQNIDNKFMAMLNDIINVIKKTQNTQTTCENLIKLQTIANNVLSFKTECTQLIKEQVEKFKTDQGSNNIAKLGHMLNKDTIGKIIVQEFKAFQGYQQSLFSQKLQNLDIDLLIENTQGSDINKSQLLKCYQQYNEKFKKLIEVHLDPNKSTQTLINNLKRLIGTESLKFPEYALPLKIIQNFPKILAHIAVIWTLQNSEYFFEAQGLKNQQDYLFIPHAGQVIALLRLFGSGDSNEQMINNLVQVNTGQGKSLILAFSSVFLALVGYDVSCACYSSYLSKRDYKSFEYLIESLGVINNIHYSTFDVICENIINENGDIRKIIQNIIEEGNQSKQLHLQQQLDKKPKVLLVDEVDVFFGQDFYGKMYNPVAQLKSEKIMQLIELIWTQRNTQLTFEAIKAHKIYKDVCIKYQLWEFLIQDQVKQMIYDVKQFKKETQIYVVQNDRIGYKEQDSISFDIFYGYKTIFAYFKEFENKNISLQCLKENVSIIINCGQFSYAEIPQKFTFIMGVTGTLDALSSQEKEVIKNDYNILKDTFIPSVYGSNNLSFAPKHDCKVQSSKTYYLELQREIIQRLNGKIPGTKRAVLVFFEDQQNLINFYGSREFQQLKEFTQCLTEENIDEEKENIIKNSTLQGQITLMTKCFARGTDFIQRDEIVSSNGGIHVIQTFISDNNCEEIQIKGRTARQGENGSFSLIILDSSLQKYLISEKDLKEHKGNEYELIDKSRNIYFNDQYQTTKKYIADAKVLHNKTLLLLENIKMKNMSYINDFLMKLNNCVQQQIVSKTLVLMDGTGSMSGLIHKVKSTVEQMFVRAYDILKDNGIKDGCFELQFAVYRSYAQDQTNILQTSGWETTPQNLRKFTETIVAKGGWNEESVEIGLQYANMQNIIEPISQVILIGDAPPTPVNKIEERRNYLKQSYWANTIFKQSTNYIIESQKLKENNIKVHAYYVNVFAQKGFNEIAKITGGQCKFLDINSQAGADDLTRVVTEAILKNVGQNSGKGDDLALQYERKFAKGSNN